MNSYYPLALLLADKKLRKAPLKPQPVLCQTLLSSLTLKNLHRVGWMPYAGALQRYSIALRGHLSQRITSASITSQAFRASSGRTDCASAF